VVSFHGASALEEKWLARHSSRRCRVTREIAGQWWFLQRHARLIYTRRELRVMFAAAIVSRMRIVERPYRRSHRRKMPPGFRWAHRCAPAVRFFTRGIRLRTLRDMRRAIDDFDAIVTRAFKRLPRDLRGGVLVMTFARKMVWAALNLAPAAEAADTS
jgi:hypothetical protein